MFDDSRDAIKNKKGKKHKGVEGGCKAQDTEV